VQCPRNHQTVERIAMIHVDGQRGDGFRAVARDGQFGETGQTKRRAGIARMHALVSLCVLDCDLPYCGRTHKQRVGGILDDLCSARRELRRALGSP
jgi:hypothetical protein